MSFLNGNFKVEWEITDGAPLSPIILNASGLLSTPECGFWAYREVYDIRLRFPSLAYKATYGDRMRVTVLNNTVTMYKNGAVVRSQAGTFGTILETEEFGLGAIATQNGNYAIIEDRQFQGDILRI